jgi:hypothetical protein
MHGSKRRETFSALQTKLNAGTVLGPYNTLYNVVQEACLDMRVRTAKSDANGVWDYEIKCNFAFGGEPHNRYKPG